MTVTDLGEVFRELRTRNEPVPRPPKLPTAAEVDAVEQDLSVSFHPDFRRYLLEVSDITCGFIEPVTITVADSHTDLRRVARSAWEDYGVARELLPICEDNADFYCMSSKGEVVFWSHNGPSSEKWASLAAWIKDVWLTKDEED